MLSPKSFYVYASFLYFGGLSCCLATDTITFDNPINSSGGQFIVSATKMFELGFFTPHGSSNLYVGIWFYGMKPRTIVWVANRDNPVTNSTTWIFGIGEDGNLILSSGSSSPSRLTDIPSISASIARTLKLMLMDSGNLVLIEDGGNGLYSSSTRVVWKSFGEPTDTFLPGMEISESLTLTSWKSQDDPAKGRFAFRQDVENQYIITDNENPHWKSGLSGNFMNNIDEIPPFISFMLLNFSKTALAQYCLKNRKENCTHKLSQSSGYNYTNARLVMGFDGKLRFYGYNETVLWSEPRDRCSVFDACGKFGSCNENNKLLCKCLPGFEPLSPDRWNIGDFAEGCTRKSSVCTQHDEFGEFLKLSMMKVRSPDSEFPVNDKDECQRRCLAKCYCQAYSYKQFETYLRGRASNFTCGIWIDDVQNIQESFTNGIDLYLHVPRSETGSRTCVPCGTNVIPYPLSTGSSCGDPLYLSFSCQNDTGQLSFNVRGGTYRVTSIDPERQRFFLQVKDTECSRTTRDEKFLQLPRSSPFFVNSTCNATPNNFSTDSSSEDKWFYEVEIGWNPPLEPICNSSKDCKDWPNSSCKAAKGKKRCLCNPPFQWDSSKVNCIVGSSLNLPRQPLGKQKPAYYIFLGVAAGMLFILCFAFVLYHKRRRRASRQGNLELSFFNDRRFTDFLYSGELRKDCKTDIEVPYFDLESILIATDNFAEANKLGQGGFGPVYKGKLPKGREIAIKRLSRGSGQGVEEFKNEVVLIAKLQHRNLVRLLGYCVKGYEKMLIYEYMPNKSLDSFIFDPTRALLLNWEKRMDIIMGIARGMLYLHQDSRLRIIHRDLKTSNVLLDEEMSPKISDFGLARIFGGKQTEASTERVVGTYGYMSPEYALDGFFSIKSDAFSFGVVLLETISGKRNTGFYQAEQPLSLLGYAWRLWKDDRVLDLAEQALRQTCNANEFIRCVNVGLLCVQEDPSDRPTMANVLFMLGSETASLPTPKQPAFVVRRSVISGSGSSSSIQQWDTELTATVEEGR